MILACPDMHPKTRFRKHRIVRGTLGPCQVCPRFRAQAPFNMRTESKIPKNTKQKRWRVTEKTAAKLAHFCREGGFRSWDDFFNALIDRWDHVACEPEVKSLEQAIQPVKEDVQRLLSQTGHFRLLMDGQVEALHALHLGQEQLYAVVSRLNGFLQLAFELAGDKASPQEPADKDTSPEAEVIRQIRNRQLA